jgi:hypothetical protein
MGRQRQTGNWQSIRLRNRGMVVAVVAETALETLAVVHACTRRHGSGGFDRGPERRHRHIRLREVAWFERRHLPETDPQREPPRPFPFAHNGHVVATARHELGLMKNDLDAAEQRGVLKEVNHRERSAAQTGTTHVCGRCRRDGVHRWLVTFSAAGTTTWS